MLESRRGQRTTAPGAAARPYACAAGLTATSNHLPTGIVGAPLRGRRPFGNPERARIVGPDRLSEAVTSGTLRAQFVSHRGPLLSEKRRAFIERTLDVWAAHLEPNGRPFGMIDFGDHHVESFTARRMAATLRGADHRASRQGVRAATVANEIDVLTTVCRRATRFPTRRNPLLSANPLDGVPVPQEKNPGRSRADQGRIRKLLAVGPKVDASGQFEMLLQLARGTGRRLAAMCHLHASDVLIGVESVRNGLARIGWDEAWAEHWSTAIHWRAEFDKKGHDWIAPIPAALEAELVA